eukprot:TRINITY_DN4548_c0_g1_i1.p1 TRINITY_DN4548_c0_g1~~TRINITY_DN4548_c0_g1_i1.p1  ORF type:complete len:629 (+),score=146.14 TRINITY_DN4548_c0_g1_i1:58-1887(+)
MAEEGEEEEATVELERQAAATAGSSLNERDARQATVAPDPYLQQSFTNEVTYRHETSVFGIRPWNTHVTRRPIEKMKQAKMCVAIGNVLWVILFGWWLSLVFFAASVLLFLTIIAYPYALFCFRMALYIVWPFEKYVIRTADREQPEHEQQPSATTAEKAEASEDTPFVKSSPPKHKYLDDVKCISIRGSKLRLIGYVFYVLIVVLPVVAALVVALGLCFFTVVFIPMSKVLRKLMWQMLFDTADIRVVSSISSMEEGSSVVVATFYALNVHYYTYTVAGMSIFIVNTIPFIPITLVLGYALPEGNPLSNPVLLFILGMVATVPLAFYIGLAVSALSRQSSFAVGAFTNSILGSLIELLLYGLSIYRGLTALTLSGVTGAILGSALLLPALSMIAGGIKYRQLRFNPVAAAASGSLLLISVIGALMPTIFYAVFASYDLDCDECKMSLNATIDLNVQCQGCKYEEDQDAGSVYKTKAVPLAYLCAAILPFAYVVGCLFTLKTHSYLYGKEYFEAHYPSHEDEKIEDEHGGSAVTWSRLTSLIVLAVCIVVYTAVADIITESVEPMLSAVGISEDFIGVTFIAIVPNLAEYVNAVQFALQADLDLSLEVQ